MNESNERESDALRPDGPRQHGLDRREFARRSLWLGVIAFGSAHALGQSLLLRSMDPSPSCVVQTTPTTITSTYYMTRTMSSTVNATFTISGTDPDAEAPGTFTLTGPPETANSITYTATWIDPAGFGHSASITQAVTMSFTPPATNYQTVSWKGNSYTITNSRLPTWFSASVTERRTISYTAETTTGGDDDDEGLPLGPIEAAPDAGALVESIDVPGLDLLDAHGRISQPRLVRLACGLRR